MKVGWLVDDPGYIGGAELTQAEFRDAAPEDVEVVDCPRGNVVQGLDRYVCHNVPFYAEGDLRATMPAPVVKFVHDMWPVGGEARGWLCDHAKLVFCSRAHMGRFPYPYRQDAVVVPPALDVGRFEQNGHDRRSGACSVAGWRGPGKGGHLLAEWAGANGPVDVYGDGGYVPHGPNLNPKGPVAPARLPDVLGRYERFVFLPVEFEPFCRTVVEAWAAGCDVVTNRLVGALEWLDNPDALETAGEDFWKAVLR